MGEDRQPRPGDARPRAFRLVYDETPADFRAAITVMRMTPTATGFRSSAKGIVGWVVLVSLALLLIYLQRVRTPTNPLPWAWLLLPTAVGLVLLWAVVAAVRLFNRRMIARALVGQFTTTMDVTDEGLFSSSGPIAIHYRWDAFDRQVATEHHLVLRFRAGANQWLVIPLRGLVHPGDRPALLALVAAAVQPTVSGFPVVAVPPA